MGVLSSQHRCNTFLQFLVRFIPCATDLMSRVHVLLEKVDFSYQNMKALTISRNFLLPTFRYNLTRNSSNGGAFIFGQPKNRIPLGVISFCVCTLQVSWTFRSVYKLFHYKFPHIASVTPK